jgi:hypothetical protein
MCFSYKPHGFGIGEEKIRGILRQKSKLNASPKTVVSKPKAAAKVRSERYFIDEDSLQAQSRERIFTERTRSEYQKNRFLRNAHGRRGRKHTHHKGGESLRVFSR